MTAAGDPTDTAEFVRRHAGAVERGVASVFHRHRPGFDDAVQMAWMHALRALPGASSVRHPESWLYRVARNAALEELRRERRRPEEPTRSDPPGPGLADTDRARRPGHALLRDALRSAIRSLPARQRRVLVLHDVLGYTHPEIARRMGTSVGTSRSQLHKARRSARDGLEGWSDAA